MSFNISEFSAQLNDHGLAKNHSFRMSITPPPIIFAEAKAIFPIVDGAIKFYCKSVTLPELDITSADVQHQGFGAITRRPQSMNFPVLPTIFNVDSNLNIVKYFQLWTQHIINYDRSQGNYGSLKGALPFELGYKNEYATVMTCEVFDEKNVPVLQYQFSGAYPINVGSVETAWANNDEVMSLAVGFSYDTLETTGQQSPDPARFGDRGIVTDPFNKFADTKVYEITDNTRTLDGLTPIRDFKLKQNRRV